MAKEIIHLPESMRSKANDPLQGTLDLTVDKEVEARGIGMGVLSDGTPFLTQRGLAALCGVQNAHIGTISSEWSEAVQKPRITAIKTLLNNRGLTFDSPHIVARSAGGKVVYAYPDTVSLAILEYYGFEAGQNVRQEAVTNFRQLAGRGLRDFIYAQVGYNPAGQIPEVWQQFHDRVSLAYHAVPIGYFSVFKEMADIIVTLINAGANVGTEFIPDISVGQHWASHWRDNNLEAKFGQRGNYPHDYPPYFPQAVSNPQPAHCYPDAALPEFRRWIREVYLPTKMPIYLRNKEKQGALPPSFVKLAITAFTGE